MLIPICVVPTRELAIQIVDTAIVPMSCNMVPKLRVQLALAQCNVKSLATPHIIVGTPGKIVDWMKRRIIETQYIKVFVLDEADTMVESGSGHRANAMLIQQHIHHRYYNLQQK
jgi:ATP-dependent RNA helicase DDX19/DBP5